VYAVPVQTVFRGETSQHRSASVLVAADGTVARIRIRYSARCRHRGYRYPNTMEAVPPFTSAAPDAVTERLTLHEPLAGGGHTTQTVTIHATRVSETMWRGTFATTAILVRRHRWLDTCRLRHVSWNAQRMASPSSARAMTSRWISLVPS
jgi:hypothetical protein